MVDSTGRGARGRAMFFSRERTTTAKRTARAMKHHPESPAGARLSRHIPDPETVLEIGHIVKPRGLRGEVKVRILCAGPDHFAECLATQNVLIWKPPRKNPRAKRASADAGQNAPRPGETPRPVRIEAVRFHGGHALVTLPGVETIEAAETLRDCRLGLTADSIPAAEKDAYYHHQLEGLRVVDARGKTWGSVREIKENPAHDHLVVQPPDAASPAFLLPWVRAVVKRVDLESGEIEVEIPAGLVESQQNARSSGKRPGNET